MKIQDVKFSKATTVKKLLLNVEIMRILSEIIKMADWMFKFKKKR